MNEPPALFGLIDAARIPEIRSRSFGDDVRFESLYRGKRASELAEVAPYLVRVNRDSELLRYLAREAWSRSWGIFLSAGVRSELVRLHLRKFLVVNLEDGRQTYFRYYDPRVLNVFLPTCTPEQLRFFFGPVDTIWAASDDGVGCIRYRLTDGELTRNEFDSSRVVLDCSRAMSSPSV